MIRSTIRSRRWAALPVAATLLLTACGSFLGTSEETYVSDEAAAGDGSTTTLPATTTPPPRTPAPPAPTGAQPALAAVSPASLASPQALEQRLADLRFDVKPDGVMDDNTGQALVAFQKLNGLPRTGKSDPAVVNALASATLPAPLKPDGEPTRVEIDLGRQVLFLYTNGSLSKVLPVSTGTGKRYCDEGKCGIATTPTGTFRVERRISGWRKSDLGRLYNPLYFKGGIAIHGFPSVPPTPASHGCVRIPMGSANSFPGLVADGTQVIVMG
ncbi:MAG TPA: L,D-transpeptidase family protein [Acidimicrobiales bacterium]|nr:L,D-transpeptidase family protein [Acidimicrobiales bacterium]